MSEALTHLRRNVLALGGVAALAVAWWAARILRAQTTGPNLLENLHLLLLAGLVAVAVILLGSRGDVPLRARAPRSAAPAVAGGWMLRPASGLPVALDRPVIQLGASASAHVRFGSVEAAARIERRGGTPHLVPQAAGWTRNGAPVDGPTPLVAGDEIACGHWAATVQEA